MATYRYLFYDISSRRLIDTLPMQDVTFGWELRGIGTFSGQIPLYADDLDPQRVRSAVLPYRTKVFAERDGALVWGGWIRAEPSYDSSTGVLGVSAEESLGYFANRYMPTVTYNGVDQLALARSIVTTAQGEPGGDFWINVDPSQSSGVVRDRSYSLYDQTQCLTALTELSEATGGFEFGSQVLWVGNVPYESLLLGYPRLGRVTSGSGLAFEYNRFVGGGNVESYTWADAGSPMATRTWANGETDEGVQLTAKFERSDLIAAGYPVMEESEDYDGAMDYNALANHAAALAAYRSGPRIAAQFVVKAQPGLQLGDFTVGDDVLVRISDWRFPPNPVNGSPGFLGYLRITGCSVAAGLEGEESYTFTCADFISTV